MSSNLSQFHFLASTVPNKFDFEAEDFDVSQIYQFYSLKVSYCPSTRPRILTNIVVFSLILALTHSGFALPRPNVRPIAD